MLADRITTWVIAFAAIGRSTGIIGAKVRQHRYRSRASSYPSTWRDRCTQPEPFLLLVVILVLLVTDDPPADPSALDAVAGIGGAVLAGAGISLMLWAVVSFPAVSPGHYILPEHRLIDRGAYALVRHPLYLAALLIWSGVTVGFESITVLVVLLAYVLPAYLIYIRAEERMMAGHFGPAYERYRDLVPGLVPRWSPARGDRGGTSP